MKKWVIGFLVIAGLAIGCIYFFIPSTIVVSEAKNIKTFRAAVARFLTSKEKMGQCFNHIAVEKDSVFSYGGFNFSINKIIYNGNVIRITADGLDVTSNLIPLEVTKDSSSLHWVVEFPAAGNNPFNRIRQYNTARRLKESMSGLLDVIKTYLENPVNMYGIEVKEIQLKDSLLISTRSSINKEPDVNDVYQQIKKLQDYALSNNATSTDAPMLHVQQNDATHFEFMVGLPINKPVPETNDIKIKVMPYGGSMFTAAIKGGPEAIKNGIKQLGIYKDDTKRTSPAIPFELLVTDRKAEPDTSKWITVLYYPVM